MVVFPLSCIVFRGCMCLIDMTLGIHMNGLVTTWAFRALPQLMEVLMNWTINPKNHAVFAGPVLGNFEKRILFLASPNGPFIIHLLRNPYQSLPLFQGTWRVLYDTFTHPGKERLCFGISYEMIWSSCWWHHGKASQYKLKGHFANSSLKHVWQQS